MAAALVVTAFTCTTGLGAPRPQNPPENQQQGCKLAHVKKGSVQDVSAIGDRNVGKGLDFYSLQREVTLGKRLAQQVEQGARFVNDPAIVNYINKVGQNLVRNSDARVPFTFKVIDSDAVNAFSLPGGFVFVNSGLILQASDEAELAGVLGHEIAHVNARHGTKQATKSDIAQMAMIPISILLPYGWAGYGIYQGLNFGIPMAFLHFSRKDEEQADYLGIQYMWKAGYDPNAYVSFFEKIAAEDRRHPETIPKVFETHPPTPERIALAQKEIATILPCRSEYIVDTSRFEYVKRQLELYENGRRLHKKRNGPVLHQKTGNDKGPVLKRRNPNDPH
jgi:predicted Zn-dependent protease